MPIPSSAGLPRWCPLAFLLQVILVTTSFLLLPFLLASLSSCGPERRLTCALGGAEAGGMWGGSVRRGVRPTIVGFATICWASFPLNPRRNRLVVLPAVLRMPRESKHARKSVILSVLCTLTQTHCKADCEHRFFDRSDVART